MVHILALEDEPTSLRGGQQLNLFEITQSLAARGHQVTLVYGRDGDLLPQYQQFCDRTIHIHRYGFDGRRVEQMVDFLPSLAKIPTLPTREDTVIFSNSCHPAFYARLMSLYSGRPIICYIQSPSGRFNKQKAFGLKGVQQFITVSHRLKQHWTQMGFDESMVDVVHNGTDLTRFYSAENSAELRNQWGIPADAKVVSYVGRIDTEKGVEVLFWAFARLKEVVENAHLLVAGRTILSINFTEGPYVGFKDYESYLRQLVIDLNIEKSVHFLGYLKETERIFQASDLTVVPSVWDEPFGRVLIESMACGTPVIASNVGGIPEILTGEFQDFMVEPGDDLQLASELINRLHWKEKDPELGDRARAHVLNQFTKEKMVEGIEKAILKVAAHG
jgi:glycosyltransferase involved in cell wall biosynthesis